MSHTRYSITGREARDWEIATQDPGNGELRMEDVRCLRTRQVDAGPVRYVEIYPVIRHRGGARAARAKATREAQQRVNRRRAREKVEQLIHMNFDAGDLFLTLTYRDQDARIGDDEVREDVRSYLRKMKRAAKKAGRELKYLYVLELPERQDGDTRGYRESMGWHVHMCLSGVDRDTAEAAWRYGYADAKRLQDSAERFTGIAKYMTKRRDSKRMWARSRNLKEPEVRVTDRRPAKAVMDRVARSARSEGREILQQIFPGYVCMEDPTVSMSDLGGAYIRIRMRRYANAECRTQNAE